MNRSLLRATRYSLAALACWMITGSVLAQTQTFVNGEPVYADFETHHDVMAMTQAQLDTALALILDKQEAIEAEHGAYHISMPENLINLARVYVEQNDYKQARYAIERALEVQRISTGLHGELQIPIVEQLILVNRALEEWGNVDRSSEYLYWLHKRVYGDNGPELLPTLKYFIYWKIEAINGALTGTRKGLLKQALDAAKHALVIIGTDPVLEEYRPFYKELKDSLQRASNSENSPTWARN